MLASDTVQALGREVAQLRAGRFRAPGRNEGHIARLLPIIGQHDLPPEIDVDPSVTLSHPFRRRGRLDDHHLGFTYQTFVSNEEVNAVADAAA